MKRGYGAALVVLTILTLLSLTLNTIVILEFLQCRQAALRVVADAQTDVADIYEDTFSYAVEIDQDIPISTEFPFSESITVPINAVVPVSTTVIVPVDLRFTTYELAVPIETVFPVDIEVTVPVSQVMDVTTVVPLRIDVPIEIPVSETPLADYLDGLSAALRRAGAQLERPVWQRADVHTTVESD